MARDFELREIGQLYYVMASSQTLGEALKRLALYSKVTNEALVFGFREGKLNLWAVIGLVCVGLWISFANTATKT